MHETFVERNFRADTLLRITQANEIIEAYAAQGFVLTLRQIYYQFVARDLIQNTERSYKALGSIINDGRLAGLIDWEAIEDRTRGVKANSHWDSPKEGVEALRAQYRIDMWSNQRKRVEVWIEKEALVGVIEGVCRSLDVPYLACRGYVSQSEQWRAYRRILANYEEHKQRTVVLHFGDHDPSGIDMTRDNFDRLELFLRAQSLDGEVVEVERLALNMEQIKKYKPPPNPAKMTDSRFGGYAARFGAKSWELDALEPRVITELIRSNVLAHRDEELYAERVEELNAAHASLDTIIGGLK